MTDTPILYESAGEGIAKITLNRPETRNAQDTTMLYALNDAFDRAAHDDSIKVVILAANGPHFSSGHDLRETGPMRTMADHEPVGSWGGYSGAGHEAMHAREKEIYFGLSERWRNFAKPTIAQVQGKCISGGLMLVWPCDIIIAADNASFQDNTIVMGIPGVEWFANPYEFGPRKAKELLFTADAISAQEAHGLGMVNHVVAESDLAAFTLALAERIAQKSSYALKLAKEAVNNAVDAQGRTTVMSAQLALHQVAHAHATMRYGMPIDPTGLDPRLGLGVPDDAPDLSSMPPVKSGG